MKLQMFPQMQVLIRNMLCLKEILRPLLTSSKARMSIYGAPELKAVSNNPVMFFPGNQHSFKKKKPNHIHCWRQITYWGLRNRGSENMIWHVRSKFSVSLLPGEKCPHQLCTLEGMGNGRFYVKKKAFALCPRIPGAIWQSWLHGIGMGAAGLKALLAIHCQIHF